jgi:hypothetical protein
LKNPSSRAGVAESEMTETGNDAKADADLIRQGERTIDNLKRLFAVFALSFGVVAAAQSRNCTVAAGTVGAARVAAESGNDWRFSS